MKHNWMMTSRIALSVVSVLSLSACAGMSERIANIGKTPDMTAISNPAANPNYQPVSMPMPPDAAQAQQVMPNSLWTAGRQTFFKDQRAQKVGDILTVLVEIKDKASLDNKTTRTRDNGEALAIPELLGLPQRQLAKILPEEVNPSSLVDMASTSKSEGNGVIDRQEEIDLKVAATISQVLPNGNLVIYGRQEVRVNNEVRELQVAGIIRSEDIANNNTIPYEKIAEARISYGGRGIVSDMQRPRYGQEFFDVVAPF